MRKDIFIKVKNTNGFTLVELMVVVVVGTIVLSVVHSAFQTQQRSYAIQEEATGMLQEVRSVMELISRDIRNAGHDMTPSKALDAGIDTAGPYQIQFTMDITDGAGTGPPNNALGDNNESVTYQFVATSDSNGDGIADSKVGDLGRDVGGGLQPLSSNVHAIGFAYAYDSDADGLVETDTSGNIIWAVPDGVGGWTDLNTSGDLAGAIDINDPRPPLINMATITAPPDLIQLRQIRAVKIWILVRATRPDPKFTDTRSYKVGANIISAPNDKYRRRLLVGTVRCRNLGLQ